MVQQRRFQFVPLMFTGVQVFQLPENDPLVVAIALDFLPFRIRFAVSTPNLRRERFEVGINRCLACAHDLLEGKRGTPVATLMF